jgi:G3E family GTPase
LTVKIDIVSGFLGAGKTTFINKVLGEMQASDTIAIIENEFGEINIDGQVLAKSGVQIREISAGCICCSLFGNFVSAMGELLSNYPLTRIIVEPTGIGRLSDVIKACNAVADVHDIELNILTTVVDCLNYEKHNQIFGQFFDDQIRNANSVFVSRTQLAAPETVALVEDSLASMNPNGLVIIKPWDDMSAAEMIELAERQPNAEGEANGESFDPRSLTPEQVLPQGYKEADFEVWNKVIRQNFTQDQLQKCVAALDDQDRFGKVFRGKGIVATANAQALMFDFVPGQTSIRPTTMLGDGKIVIIGTLLNQNELDALFNSVGN